MVIKVGDKLPDGKVTVMGEDGPEQAAIADVLGEQTTVLFAVPGAFTPTCSARHLPGFRDLSEQLAEKGIGKIACIAVNDIFVLEAWKTSQDVEDQIVMISDGNGEFTRALGLDLDASGYGMGLRSQRYSMLLDPDGTVRMLNVEEGADFSVSSAEYLIENL